MTLTEIIVAVSPFKPMSRETLYTHFRALNIKPLGARQCPQHYPDNTAERVLLRLGFTKTPAPARRNGHSKRSRRVA